MLLDTSGLFCLFRRDEAQHPQAVQLFEAARAKLTHNYVLAEFVALAHARGLPRAPALAFVTGLLGHPDVGIQWVDEALHRAAVTLLGSRLDKSYSLCDAVSFLLMR